MRPQKLSALTIALACAGVVLLVASAPRGAAADPASSLPAPRGSGEVHTPQRHPANRAIHHEAARQPIIIGNDDRVRITGTTEYPFSAVAWLELYDGDDNEIGNCTGTFIGPDAVLTAAHCLYDPETGWIANVAVVPGRDDTFEPFGWEWAENYWVPDGWFETGGPLYDWGIIKMASSDLGDTVGWFYIAELTTQTLLSPQFEPAIAGYPGDVFPKATMWFDWMPWFTDVDDFILYHEIDTYPGMSGSAVFSSNSDWDLLGAIAGIHVRGDSLNQVNEAMRIDAFIIADLDEGCFQMGCSFVYYVEPAPSATPTPQPTPTATPTAPPVGPLNFKLRLPLVGRD